METTTIDNESSMEIYSGVCVSSSVSLRNIRCCVIINMYFCISGPTAIQGTERGGWQRIFRGFDLQPIFRMCIRKLGRLSYE